MRVNVCSACSVLLGACTAVSLASAQITSRIPQRICLAESYTSTSSSCTLLAGVPAGDGLVVFGTSPLISPGDVSHALQDSRGNAYTQLESQAYSGNSQGTIYLWFGLANTALLAGDTITLGPVPTLSSWDFQVYDIGPVASSASDVGVAFSNSNVGTSGITNPATGVGGWWTGVTTATSGTQDLCIAGMTANTTGGGNSPSPITSYTIDNSFRGLDIVDFHSPGTPTANTPNYGGGALMTMFREAPSGTAVQAHVITSQIPDQAASAMFCFKESAGSVTTFPRFTGNWCTGSTSCTLNNVAAGDMLVISTHTLDQNPPVQPPTVTDSRGEAVLFDAANAGVDLGTWHIAPVVNAGTHTITFSSPGSTGQLLNVAEITGQASGNPVEAMAQNLINAGNLGAVSLTTATQNDMVYGWGRAAEGSDEGDGYTAIAVAPTAEFAAATGPGPVTVSIYPRGGLPQTDIGIQSLAIRPVGSSPTASGVPRFTGNYCIGTGAGCTITNVQAGDMLIASLYWAYSNSGDKPVLVDTQSESVSLDRQNDYDGIESLATWHITRVANAGTHTFSITSASVPYSHMVISEFSGQNTASPIDAAPVGKTGSGTQASTSLQTTDGGDLIYSFCSGINGSGTGDGFASVSLGPTAEYRNGASTPGTENAACPMNGSSAWAIQEIAIKGGLTSGGGAPLVSMAVTPANGSLPAGETEQFTATGTFSDQTTQNITNAVTWSSQNTATATVNQAGLASGVAIGSTMIQANSNSTVGSTELSVSAPALVSLSVTPANSSVQQGSTLQFSATGTYSDGSTQNLTSSVAWSSNNTSLATINAAGQSTGVAPGSVTVMATSGSVSGSTGLTVTPILVSIAVTPANPSIFQGATLQFAATGTYSDNSTQNLTNSVAWSSGSTGVATVTSAGLATGVAAGSTSITAASGNISGSTNITITAITLVSIAVTPANSSVASGATLQFTATGTYSNNSTQNITSGATWSSTNSGAATVNSAGLATGVAQGSTTIASALGSVNGSTPLAITSSYPGVNYDTWVDFEQCASGAAPTTTCLAQSTHGAAGTWDVSHVGTLVTVQSAAADPDASTDGSNATRGLAYDLANGGEAYTQWAPPTQLSRLSFGMWIKTGKPSSWVEGPHFVTLFNNAFGNMLRLSDEHSGGDNARQFRVSPLDVRVTGISDNTWYWVTVHWVQGGAGQFSVYTTSFTLVGTVSFTDPFNFPVQKIMLGNTSATPGETGEMNYMDDLIVNYTSAPFPLLPSH